MSDVVVETLILTPAQKQQIESEGVAAYPDECCGIIYGHMDQGRRIVDELEPVINAFEEGEQYHRFSISGQQLMAAEKKCTGKKLVLGFYHSHPDHPARPSEYDLEHAWPFYSYVIVAIEKRQARDMTSWLLNDATEQFESQRICLA